MSIIPKALKFGKAVALILFYPWGCWTWINTHYRDPYNKPFIGLALFGLACLILMLASAFHGYLPVENRSDGWKTVLLVCAVVYGLGVIAFIMISWTTKKCELQEEATGNTPSS